MGQPSKQTTRQLFAGGSEQGTRSYSANGPIPPTLSHNALLTKGAVGAYTLAAPARDGVDLRIISRTSNAHVLTATTLLDDGVTGAPHTTATFAAFPGASISLLS